MPEYCPPNHGLFVLRGTNSLQEAHIKSVAIFKIKTTLFAMDFVREKSVCACKENYEYGKFF